MSPFFFLYQQQASKVYIWYRIVEAVGIQGGATYIHTSLVTNLGTTSQPLEEIRHTPHRFSYPTMSLEHPSQSQIHMVGVPQNTESDECKQNRALHCITLLLKVQYTNTRVVIICV